MDRLSRVITEASRDCCQSRFRSDTENRSIRRLNRHKHIHIHNMTTVNKTTTPQAGDQVREDDYLLINKSCSGMRVIHRARRKERLPAASLVNNNYDNLNKVRSRIKTKNFADKKSTINPLSARSKLLSRDFYLLLKRSLIVTVACVAVIADSIQAQQQATASSATTGNNNNNDNRWPDLVSSTSDEPIVAVVGQDAFISCVAKNLQNYTIIWRYTNDANAPGAIDNNNINSPSAGSWSGAEGSSGGDNGKQQLVDGEMGIILTAGRQRVIGDDRFSVIQSHDTWLLKIQNVRLSDTGTYICHTNSEPRRRAFRILSVIKSINNSNGNVQDVDSVDCCRAEYVVPRCQRLCSFQSLASRYQSINIVHECFSALPSITRCMVAGRNVTDCCERRHIPARCNPMCGHLGDTSSMSVQDQSYCADYSASIMSCVADGLSTLPGQPELVIVEAVSSTTLKVSWQKVTDENELKKIDGWIINLTKLSSFEDTITSANGNGSGQLSATSAPQQQQQQPPQPQVSSSFSSSSNSKTPLGSLSIVDVMNNSSLAAMTKLLAASSGTISLKLDKASNEYSIDNLKPYTVYQIQMFAYNSLGRSQLTDPIRALTLAPESEQQLTTASSSSSSGNLQTGDAYVEPNLPDTRKCCIDRGVTLKRCLDTLCDPVEADRATIADLMICAPWSNITFSCLSSRVNHTDCCKSRGVSPFCLSMCSGEIKRVDYRHFRCLTHMSTYTNCILESHNVLPSPPLNFTVGPMTHSWAVLNWRAPKKNARSLQGYRIFWRRVEPLNNNPELAGANSSSPSQQQQQQQQLTTPINQTAAALNDEFYYMSAEAATNPYLLDALTPDTVYETFVVAVNKFGQSEPSVRFVFHTLADPEVLMKQKQQSLNGDGDIEARLPLHGGAGTGTGTNKANLYYNETSCCETGGVSNSCLQLCDYDMKVSDVNSLITNCNQQMPVILRCMAGSRNSVPCCRNRGVADNCLNVCAGLTEHSPLVVATRCASDFGKIIRCMDEGSKQIPASPIDLHTQDIKSDRVTIKWLPASEDALRHDIEYHVRYQQLQTASPAAGGQDQAASSSASDIASSLIAVVPLHPLEHNLILTTNKTEATIDKLKPNSRYSIYVTAENSYGISLPSLVLIIQTPSQQDENNSNDQLKRRATLGAPHSLEVLRTDTESIVLKWIAPLFITNDAQIRYRVFYKLFSSPSWTGNETSSSTTTTSTDQAAQSNTPANNNQAQDNGANSQVAQVSSNWTVIETSDTAVILRNLRYSSQYVITVQAYSKQMLGHMSEILLASTAKPVPPTLNHPLVINNPVEGNNITIMCVALGQPTPQISMFINGLLVQKRTQPYVIYHLVNLVRGHLTINCFASNGHGKNYASVQSRTEVSVKFPTKVKAKSKEIRVNQQSTGRLSCEVAGNPQPTIVWTFTPTTNENNNNSSTDLQQHVAQNSDTKVIIPGDRITTLLFSQFDNPFTWTHTLTIRNVSQADVGLYACRARNSLAESTDTIQLTMLRDSSATLNNNNIAGGQATSITGDGSSSNFNPNANSRLTELSSSVKQIEQNSDLMECCKSQNVSAKCLPVCSIDGLDIETAFKTPECQNHLDKLMYCAADGSDHRNCCRTRQVPSSCLRWCSGAKLNIPAFCFLSSAIDINQCFQEGRTLLPGPPRNIRVMLASQSEHDKESEVVLSSTTTTTMSTANMFVMDKLTGNNNNNNAGGSSAGSDTSNNNSSVIHSLVMMMGDQAVSAPTSPSSPAGEQEQSQGTATSSPSTTTSEPLIIEWDPPIKNAQLVQYYRIFWRPFGSRELSRMVTNSTWIKLNDLNVNKIYEFVVKAANNHGSSVYSDPITVKPAEILAQSNTIGSSSSGLIWFMPTSQSSNSIGGRILMSITFATMFMFTTLAVVVFLERGGYLKRFASSKSNNSRISFANPAYLKDSDGNNDQDNITWENGHSLDILAPPPITQQ